MLNERNELLYKLTPSFIEKFKLVFIKFIFFLYIFRFSIVLMENFYKLNLCGKIKFNLYLLFVHLKKKYID